MITKLNHGQFEESLQLSEYAFQYEVPSEDRESAFNRLKITLCLEYMKKGT
ncbi:hypothetical protein [Rossellomorea aquimaris]|uniref:hypothetical protein n=1 Tax=Rossellomorea aquimaris TaxID=189382 RepID=UPI0024948FCB|nr:hypothetical protein [Rossellomorea aquimaris]